MRYVIRHVAALRYRLAPGRLQGNDHIAQQPRRGRVSQGRSLCRNERTFVGRSLPRQSRLRAATRLSSASSTLSSTGALTLRANTADTVRRQSSPAR